MMIANESIRARMRVYTAWKEQQRLERRWQEAERLCNALCYNLNWRYSDERVQRVRAKARARADRRWEKVQAAERSSRA